MDIRETHFTSATGRRIFRRTLLPTASVRSGVLVLHGLGDHIARHDNHLRTFVDRGVICCGIDLPGHGRSEGLRGHIDSMQTVLDLLDETVEHLRELLPSGAPVGLVGHSMGGFLGLYYLAERPGLFDYAWISSPLIDARKHGHWLMRALLHLAGFFWPTLTIRSRVRSKWCKRDAGALAATQSDPFVHRNISLALIRMLLCAAPRLLQRKWEGDLELLMTHGGRDRICPARLSESFFRKLPFPNKRYCHFADLLHEPFNDIGRESVLEEVERWLDQLFDPDAATPFLTADPSGSDPVSLLPASQSRSLEETGQIGPSIARPIFG